MKTDKIFLISFVCCMILGLMYFYCVGTNGYTTRTQVVYAVTDMALPFYIIDNLFLFWFPFSVLLAYCIEHLYNNVINVKQKQDKNPQFNFRYAFYIYISIIILKILQLWMLGEYIINDTGELLLYPSYSPMRAVLHVISISSIWRHLFWIVDSVTLSYLITRMIIKTD